MRHLFLCREYPPAAYPPGGIGTYVDHISRQLAAAGETVHVVAHRWSGAPSARESLLDGRLVIHRIALDDEIAGADDPALAQRIRIALLASSCPAQTFSWQAALFTEHLLDREGIDVIEAQEWEAPLYYFLLRRRLGLATSHRRPACVVHLHSPSARIYEANGWDRGVADYAPTVALEAFCIRNADAILSPSRFVADQAIADYGISPDRVTVIPYPMGEAPLIERSARTWTSGSIVHIGRLEGRKGITEFGDALAMVDAPGLAVEMVGGDTPVRVTGGATVGEALRSRLDRKTLRQLRFHGSRDRTGVRDVLGRSWASVVPSRWENFPYSCIEAMASGVPVIASPDGGMRELVEDGVSGWIADAATPLGLAGALRRALAASPDERAQMGSRAAARVRDVCGNEAVIERHLSLKRRLASAPSGDATAGRPAGDVGLIVIDRGGADLASCLESVAAQKMALAAVCVLTPARDSETSRLVHAHGWTLVTQQPGDNGQEISVLGELLRIKGSLASIVLLDARARLSPEFTSTCAGLFAGMPPPGLVTTWTTEHGGERLHVPPDPSHPQDTENGERTPCLAVGADTLAKSIARAKASASLDDLLADCAASAPTLVYPGVLYATAPGLLAPRRKPRFSAMARGLRRLHMPLLRWFFDGTAEDRRTLLAQAFRNPGQSARHIAAPLKRLLKGDGASRRSNRH